MKNSPREKKMSENAQLAVLIILAAVCFYYSIDKGIAPPKEIPPTATVIEDNKKSYTVINDNTILGWRDDFSSASGADNVMMGTGYPDEAQVIAIGKNAERVITGTNCCIIGEGCKGVKK